MKPDQTLAWMHDGTRRLLADVAGLTDEALEGPTALPGWSRRYLVSKVITAQGLTRSASEIPWMRDREVFIHAVDLGAVTAFADLPAGFLSHPPRLALGLGG
jgi:maleylpyruvate isomerase